MKTLLLLTTTLLAGCGAFADAANTDSGTPDSEPTLLIQPNPFIQRDQVKEFQISFTKDPPWLGTEGAKGYMTGFDLGCDDVGYRSFSYDGQKTVTAVLQAERTAVLGERKLTITASYERLGAEQQTHSEWNIYYVYDSPSTDGGTN